MKLLSNIIVILQTSTPLTSETQIDMFQQASDVQPMLFYCSTTVEDGTALKQHRVNISCFHGWCQKLGKKM